ncbi:MAG TPA: apolipoprotein N-acyltransferase [Burkholderiales bacterium]|nr:apolipoprotein N-acyltransferase [Burkholderiales bacterium]
MNAFPGGVNAVSGGVIAFLAGAATVVAFAPAGVYPIALVTFALLAYRWSEASPRQCFLTGFLFGFGFFAAGVSWVYVSMSEFGGMPAPLAVFATAAFCAFLALFPAIAGWLQARIPASAAVRACLLIPAAWTLFEWLRGTIFTGFPWISVGYAAVGWPTQGYAPLGGVYALSFLTLTLAGTVWLLYARTRRVLALVIFVATLGAGEALRHVAWTTPAGEPFEASLLQGNVRQEMKFRPERYAAILETYLRLADGSRAKLIVLPETAVPRFLDQVEPGYLAALAAIARRNGGDLLLGVAYREPPQSYYNSVVTLGVSPPQIYHKTHLVPFGEFVPPGFDWLMRTVDIPMSNFSRGKPAPPLEAAGQRVAVNICYEDAFGDEIAARLPEATLLVNVSNVAWFGDSLAPSQHLQIARLRAIETGRMHLAATNTGVTAAIDRDGRLLARLPQYTEGLLEVRAQGYTGATPYATWRDWPVLALCLVALVASVIIGRIRHR